MKITALETIQVAEFPNLIWLHIHTDEGLIGLGESFFWRGFCRGPHPRNYRSPTPGSRSTEN